MSRQPRRTPFLQLAAGAYTPLPQNDEDSPPPEVQLEAPSNRAMMGIYCSSLYLRWLDGEFTIVPDETRLLDAWDATVLLALAYTATILPYEVAFLQGTPPELVGADNVVYWVFVVDMLLTFMVAFPVPRAMTNNNYERAPIKIIKHYMEIPRGWFWADLFTVIPWHHMTGFKSISVVRIFRLVRLVRLVRIMKLVGRWHSRVGLSYALVDVLKCITITFALLHWLSCVWGFLAINGHRQGDHTWYSNYVYMLEEDMQVFTPHRIYATALYFCAATLTSVGFGDIAPKNLGEIVVSICTIFWTGFMWAGVVAIVVNVVTNWDPCANDFQKISDNLNMLMETRGLPSNLRTRARKHLQESFDVYKQRFQRETIKALSPGLQVEVAIASGAVELIENVSYLRGLGEEVVTELVSLLEPEMYSPLEFVVDKLSVSVIRWGTCWWKTRIIAKDAVIGEDVILTSTMLRDAVRPRTLTFVELMSLSRDSLGILTRMFPHFDRKIRLAQVRMATRRGIIEYTRRLRRAEERQAQVDANKITVKAVEENYSQKPNFHADPLTKLIGPLVDAVKTTISSEPQPRKEQEPYCSHEQKEEPQKPGTVTTQQVTCCCADLLEAIDRIARLQEQLRDRIDAALAEKCLPQSVPMNSSPRVMAKPCGTEDHFSLNDEFTQACAGSSTVTWPGSRLPDGETGGFRDKWQRLSSVAMEAQLDALAAQPSRSASPAAPAAASVLGEGQTSDDQLLWLALFQRQSAKIDGLKDSLDLVLGEVKHQVSEALGHGRSGAYFGTGCYGAAQRQEDGPVARYRRLTQQLHQQNQQRLQQQLHIAQQMHPMQLGQVAGDTGHVVANSQLGFSGVGQPMASWVETPEVGIASWAHTGGVNRITTPPT